jgi:hypothetical protein
MEAETANALGKRQEKRAGLRYVCLDREPPDSIGNCLCVNTWMRSIAMRKSTPGRVLVFMGSYIAIFSALFAPLANADGRFPLPDVLHKVACYCVVPADHVALSAIRADCDSQAGELGFPHGIVLPLESPQNNSTISICVVCLDPDEVEYACFVADPPRKK